MTKTFLEVQNQIAALQKQAEMLKKKEAAEVLTRIKEAISVYGFTAEELGVGSGRRAGGTAVRAARGGARGKGTPKFKDDKGNVWGGRGPRPAWFKAALAAGKTPEQLAA